MNSLLAQIQVILDGLAGDVTPKQREILELASGKVFNLVNLVSDLLDLAKIEAGMLEREMEEIDLVELLEDQAAFHQAAAQENDTDLSLHCDAIPLIVGNRQGVEGVLTNLITNAIKHSPKRSSITISASSTDDMVVIRISDNGPGIEAEHLPRIFEKFYRVKSDAIGEAKGTGLGLAIAKSIVEAHGGTIEVESERGKGTTFIVSMPIRQIPS